MSTALTTREGKVLVVISTSPITSHRSLLIGAICERVSQLKRGKVFRVPQMNRQAFLLLVPQNHLVPVLEKLLGQRYVCDTTRGNVEFIQDVEYR